MSVDEIHNCNVALVIIHFMKILLNPLLRFTKYSNGHDQGTTCPNSFDAFISTVNICIFVSVCVFVLFGDLP